MSALTKLSVRSLVKKPALDVAKPDKKWPLPESYIGVEIETEATRLMDQYRLADARWAMHNDGSLRNDGMEFTFAKPLCGAQITTAIDVFFDQDNPVVKYEPNPRAAIHVHINWLDDEGDIRSLRNLISIMNCIEPAVFEWVDADRKWCGYCSQLSELPDARMRTLMTTESADVMAKTLMDQPKNRYYGLNLAALNKFGTLEFRYFPCTKDKAKMEDWIAFVMLAKKAACEFEGDTAALIELLSSEIGIRDFVTRYFNRGTMATSLLNALDMNAAVLRMIDFGYLVHTTPARNNGRGVWVQSLAATRFIQKRFPQQAEKQKQTDDFVRKYKGAVAAPLGDNYERLLQELRNELGRAGGIR